MGQMKASLFDGLGPEPYRFDGATYEPKHDRVRLTGQTLRVYEIVIDGRWRTLAEIEAITGDPQASISARLRDLRKERFGSHVVERRARGGRKRGLWEYRVKENAPAEE